MTKSTIPAEYLAALGGEDPLVIQKQAPARLKKLLRGRSERELALRPGRNKWSVKEVIGHLADHEVVYGCRLRFVAALDRPVLTGYDQDLFVTRLGLERATTKALFQSYESVRKANNEFVRRLDASAFDRIGLHAERGEESLRTIVTRNAGHDRLHEAQIVRTLSAVNSKKRSKSKARRK